MRSSGATPRPSKTSTLWPTSEPAGEAAPTNPESPFAGCVTRNLAALSARGLRFGTVYADPPWAYQNTAARGAAENHYRTMSLDDICRLPVPSISAARAHLHLWTTTAFLSDAFAVIRAWDFTYKSCFVWVKPLIGCGNYWRLAHEFLLLGVRGRTPFRDKTERSWRELTRGRHSGKPERVREIIERVSPGPYLELFGRKPVAGWVVFGDAIERSLFDLDIPNLDATAKDAANTELLETGESGGHA
jgi:N6-adenosine-specific RNA methylase IME4